MSNPSYNGYSWSEVLYLMKYDPPEVENLELFFGVS